MRAAICATLVFAAQSCAATIAVGLGDNYEDGVNYTYAPGDTFLIEAGRRNALHFKHFHGTPERPLLFVNHGGQVRIGKEHYYGLTFDSCSHVRVSGTGDTAYDYGIVIDGTASGVGLGVGGLSTDFEIDHIEICSTGFAGIMVKQDFGGTPPEPYPVFRNLVIHDAYIHHTGGEGMYLGETKSPGMEFHGVHVYNNCVAYTGWDCFQIANAVEDVDIHNNVFYAGGIEDVQYQGNVMQIGDNTVGRYHHNVAMFAPANGIIVMGSGDIVIDSNYFAGLGGFGSFIDNRDFTLDSTAIELRANFFSDVADSNPFFRVNNELNDIVLADNMLDGGNTVLSYCCGAGPNIDENGNIVTTVAQYVFVDSSGGDFHWMPDTPYEGIGLLGNTHHASVRDPVLFATGAVLTRQTSPCWTTVSGRRADRTLSTAAGMLLSRGRTELSVLGRRPSATEGTTLGGGE